MHSWLISFRSFIFIHFCLIPLGLASQGKRSASFISNLNLVFNISGQANSILLPLEASLASDLADAFLHENSSNNRIGSRSLFVHGKALYQSYNFKVREACQAWAPLVPSLTLHATHLHSILIKLGHLKSTHACRALHHCEKAAEVPCRGHRLLHQMGRGWTPGNNHLDKDDLVCSFEVLICLHFGSWGQNLTTRLEMIDSFSPVSAVKDSRLTPPLPRG